MKDLFSKCGFNCGRCAAYKENVKTKKARQRGSEAWKKYYGFKIKIDRMYCDGCQTPDEKNPILLARGCTIRTCAIINGVKTCAHCSAFDACIQMLRIFTQGVDRKRIETRIGAPISDKDYQAYIEPYENLNHLDKIRSSLALKDIKDAKVSDVKPRIVDFPDSLAYSKKEISGFKALHKLLANIISLSGNTYAQQVALKKRKQYFLTLLWTFGLYGDIKKKGVLHLTIDSTIYMKQKLIGDLSTVLTYFTMLKKFGIRCEHLPEIKEKYGKNGWLTPMGWLRHKGWHVTLSFDSKAGGVSALKALQRYTSRLNKKYGKKAFRYFGQADMRVL